MGRGNTMSADLALPTARVEFCGRSVLRPLVGIACTYRPDLLSIAVVGDGFMFCRRQYPPAAFEDLALYADLDDCDDCVAVFCTEREVRAFESILKAAGGRKWRAKFLTLDTPAPRGTSLADMAKLAFKLGRLGLGEDNDDTAAPPSADVAAIPPAPLGPETEAARAAIQATLARLGPMDAQLLQRIGAGE
jgi:hypothetical protein